MKIAITGSSGLIGSTLKTHFKNSNHSITPIVRKASHTESLDDVILWDIDEHQINLDDLEGFDVIIHLAGESLASHRWSKAFKEKIYRSRLNSTHFLSESIAHLKKPPQILICASAVGFYGNHPPQNYIDETTPHADDFLAHVCRKWEEATLPAKKVGVRVVNLRFGMVLSPKGGGLAKMLPIFKMGLGGKLGNGQQMMSWISLDEIPLIVDFVIQTPALQGPINAVSPHPVTNSEFTKVLGHIIHRPAILPVPAMAVELAFGEMGKALLLNGARVVPQKLRQAGYQFKYPTLDFALKRLLHA